MTKEQRKAYKENWKIKNGNVCKQEGCDKIIHPGANYCRKHFQTGERNHIWKGPHCCEDCGKKLSHNRNATRCSLCANRKKGKDPKARENMRRGALKRSQNPEYIEKLSGSNNSGWKGGISYLRYPRGYREIRKIVKCRDYFTCKLCGTKHEEGDRELHTHHLDGNPQNNNLMNLITVCRKCHFDKHKAIRTETNAYAKAIVANY